MFNKWIKKEEIVGIFCDGENVTWITTYVNDIKARDREKG